MRSRDINRIYGDLSPKITQKNCNISLSVGEGRGRAAAAWGHATRAERGAGPSGAERGRAGSDLSCLSKSACFHVKLENIAVRDACSVTR